MSQNRLGIVTVALIALIGLTVWRLGSKEAEDSPPELATVKLPKIEKDKIEELEISAPDKPKVRLVKQGDSWRMAEPVDALADQEAVTNALTKLGELEVSGVAATKAKNHARLEVDGAKGTHVIAKVSGKPLFDGWIGVYQAGNTMLRLQGQDAVATVRGSTRYAFSKQPREWRDRKITEVSTESVKQITFVSKNGRFVFARDGEEWKQITGKGEKAIAPLDVSKVKGLVGTAASLSAVDFAEPGVTAAAAGLAEGAATVTVEIEDEKGKQALGYRVGSQKDANYYLQREGVDTIFLVSTWIGGRLTPAADTFVKKEEPAAAGAPGAGAPGDPHAMMGGPQGMQGMPQGLPPGFTMQQVPAPGAAKPPAAGAKPAAAKPAAAKPGAAKPGAAAKPPAAKPAVTPTPSK